MQAYEGAREFAELVSAGSGIDKVVLHLEKSLSHSPFPVFPPSLGRSGKQHASEITDLPLSLCRLQAWHAQQRLPLSLGAEPHARAFLPRRL